MNSGVWFIDVRIFGHSERLRFLQIDFENSNYYKNIELEPISRIRKSSRCLVSGLWCLGLWDQIKLWVPYLAINSFINYESREKIGNKLLSHLHKIVKPPQRPWERLSNRMRRKWVYTSGANVITGIQKLFNHRSNKKCIDIRLITRMVHNETSWIFQSLPTS